MYLSAVKIDRITTRQQYVRTLSIENCIFFGLPLPRIWFTMYVISPGDTFICVKIIPWIWAPIREGAVEQNHLKKRLFENESTYQVQNYTDEFYIEWPFLFYRIYLPSPEISPLAQNDTEQGKQSGAHQKNIKMVRCGHWSARITIQRQVQSIKFLVDSFFLFCLFFPGSWVFKSL